MGRLTVTLVDGLVLARSAFHHSINYRSVVLLGEARTVTEPSEKLRALEAFTDQLLPGRWSEVRPPNAKELKATTVVAPPLDQVSAKVRTGPPSDEDADYALDAWAGEIPLQLSALEPKDDPRLRAGIARPTQIGYWGSRRAIKNGRIDNGRPWQSGRGTEQAQRQPDRAVRAGRTTRPGCRG